MPDGTGGNHTNPEDIDRKLRELTEEIGKSRVGGPTPLERMVAARQAEKQALRKHDTRVLVALTAAALVIVGGGVATWLRVAPPSWLHHRAAARPAPSAKAAPKVSVARPFATVTANGPPTDPFASSPADIWADGAAGITIPAARAVGPYRAAQVRSAYEMTRKLLIAANLDWPTLRGGTPTAFADLLTQPERRLFLAGLRKTALDKNGAAENTRAWVTSFAPGSAKFLTTVVKVHGTMRARTATVSGTEVLRVTVDYLFVYVIEPPGKPADWMRIVQQQFGTVDFGRWDVQGGSFEPWFGASGSTAGALCGERDGYIHPDYPSGPAPSVQPSGAPEDPYSLATPSATSGCHQTTGT